MKCLPFVAQDSRAPPFIYIYIYMYIHMHTHTLHPLKMPCGKGLDGWEERWQFLLERNARRPVQKHIHTHTHTYTHIHTHTHTYTHRDTQTLHCRVSDGHEVKAGTLHSTRVWFPVRNQAPRAHAGSMPACLQQQARQKCPVTSLRQPQGFSRLHRAMQSQACCPQPNEVTRHRFLPNPPPSGV